MSQRNPMNDRYQTDEHRGQTRKSAATLKPKTKPASTVRVQPATKTKQQKKAEKKAERARRAELDRKYYNPPTKEYKRLRTIWWVIMGAAVVLIATSFLVRNVSETVSFVMLALIYALMLVALYLEFFKIRKLRKSYQAGMASKKTKEQRAAEKEIKAAQRTKKQEAEKQETVEETPEKSASKPRGLFGSGFRLSNREKAKEEKATEQDKN